MKRVFCFFVIVLMASQLFAFNARKTTVEDMYEEIQSKFGHEIEKYEQNIIDITYLYYFKKCEWNWTKETWEIAVNKSVELCHNNIAIAASKIGEFGEKLLQSLIVTTEDIFSGIGNWLNRQSEEYKRRHQ